MSLSELLAPPPMPAPPGLAGSKKTARSISKASAIASSEPRPTHWYQLFREVPKDPWGSNYIYLSPGRKNPTGYDLYSAGPDRKADTADDDWGQ